MSGETDLGKLLSGLAIEKREGRWLFVTGPEANREAAVMSFQEREGWTHIVPAYEDQEGYIWLELAIHSSLEAVGFLAAVSRELAEKSIPCNAIAAYYHDHVFVPEAKAAAAIEALRALAARHKTGA